MISTISLEFSQHQGICTLVAVGSSGIFKGKQKLGATGSVWVHQIDIYVCPNNWVPEMRRREYSYRRLYNPSLLRGNGKKTGSKESI